MSSIAILLKRARLLEQKLKRLCQDVEFTLITFEDEGYEEADADFVIALCRSVLKADDE